MKRIVMLALMMLIGGYGAAQAETTDMERAQMEQATQTEDATKDFLGLEWGAGIGVMGGFGGDQAVEKAAIDSKGFVRIEEEGDFRPQMFLEMHTFLSIGKVKDWRSYQRWKSAEGVAAALNRKNAANPPSTSVAGNVPEPPLMGFGPFIALQSSDNEAIDAFALGLMWGFRKDPKESTSLNIGIGLSFDPSVQVLRGDMKDGVKTDEKEIRFKKESRLGWALMTSFTF